MPDAEKPTIQLTLHHLGEEHRMQTFHGQYYSLMTLIADHLAFPGFGVCCGMGSCGTCRVQITAQHSTISRNVLACAIQVNDGLSNADIIIPDKMY
ncbi:MAG: 2Fe-2S iron-sulfur cluster binding domain-containing protein [Mucilaginibacter sp.]